MPKKTQSNNMCNLIGFDSCPWWFFKGFARVYVAPSWNPKKGRSKQQGMSTSEMQGPIQGKSDCRTCVVGLANLCGAPKIYIFWPKWPYRFHVVRVNFVEFRLKVCTLGHFLNLFSILSRFHPCLGHFLNLSVIVLSFLLEVFSGLVCLNLLPGPKN